MYNRFYIYGRYLDFSDHGFTCFTTTINYQVIKRFFMDSFKDIRPFYDDEVPTILKRLLKDNALMDALIRYQYPRAATFLLPILRPLLKIISKHKIKDVHSFQMTVRDFLENIIKRTSEGVKWTGIDKLDHKKAYLFLSNHRDIVLDPALVNYSLNQTNMQTVRIAIGDNLVKKPYVNDLMRLNKSFLVQRSITNKREKLKAYHKLSAFIHHSIEDNHSIWIAHREGRAKDGHDFTDPALIKMLHISKKQQGISFQEMMSTLAIVPVAISYEFDPCDVDKAKELTITNSGQPYIKQENEDLNSILKGFQGWKGKMHIAFGEPLNEKHAMQTPETPQEIAKAIDSQIHNLYRLYPSNYIAYEHIHGKNHPNEIIRNWRNAFDTDEIKEKERLFLNRVNLCPESYRSKLLDIYANPVVNYCNRQNQRTSPNSNLALDKDKSKASILRD